MQLNGFAACNRQLGKGGGPFEARFLAMYQIEIFRPWRFFDRARGAQSLAPGFYAVPIDISEAIAKRAVDQGMGRRLNLPPEDTGPPAEAVPVIRKRGRPPKNRALNGAPNNKS